MQVQGWSGGEADTILGYDKLVQKFSGLAGDARQLQAARKKSRRQLDELLESAKVRQNNNNHFSNSDSDSSSYNDNYNSGSDSESNSDSNIGSG